MAKARSFSIFLLKEGHAEPEQALKKNRGLKAEDFIAENAALLADIRRRKAAGQLGRASFISEMTERARQEGFNAGMNEAFRRGLAAARDEEEADLESIEQSAKRLHSAELLANPGEDDDSATGGHVQTEDLARAARATGRQGKVQVARAEQDEVGQESQDRGGMDPA